MTIKFEDILSFINSGKYNAEIIVKGENFDVKSLCYNSGKINEYSIFFSIKGYKQDGSIYIPDSINRGCKAVISDSQKSELYKEICKKQRVWLIKVDNIRKLMAVVSAYFNGNPFTRLKIIAVTGTNGKTTTTFLLKHFIEANGFKCGLIGTIDYFTGKERVAAGLTTPDSVEIQSLMSIMVENGFDYCVMETSSIALELDRVYGIEFIAGIFSNLTSEHLDLHINMENYLNAKKILFDSLDKNSIAVSNLDDEYGEKIVKNTKAKKIFYSMEKNSDYKVGDTQLSLNGVKFSIINNNEEYQIESGLAGRFNIYNITAALACVKELGLNIHISIDSLRNFGEVNGRFNSIKLPNKAYAVIDYSHTSDSLKNAILAAKEILEKTGSKSKVITIFGCGGNRDRTKRPVMGKYATEFSDYTIITSDNPRYEEPVEIINEILKGVDKKLSNYEVEENREFAIKKGIEISKEGDIILICGKGHETYQEIKGVKYDFDDRKIVEKLCGIKSGGKDI